MRPRVPEPVAEKMDAGGVAPELPPAKHRPCGLRWPFRLIAALGSGVERGCGSSWRVGGP